MLDHIERWRFLVKPAGEHATPPLVGPLHVDLDEGSGKLLLLPGSSRFTSAQVNDQVVPASGLARVQRDRLHNAVTLVEHAKDSDALRHRRDSGGVFSWSGGLLCGLLLRLLAFVAASSERQSRNAEQ